MIITSFGSNLSFCGQLPAQIVTRAMAAVVQLARPGGQVLRSGLYETEAWPDPADPPFINAVMAMGSCDLAPAALLAALQAIEDGFGRVRAYAKGQGQRFGPRTLDIDLIAYHGEVLKTETLTLPHPRLAERGFVLVPLAEILTAWPHPVSGQKAGQMLAELDLDNDKVRRLDPNKSVAFSAISE